MQQNFPCDLLLRLATVIFPFALWDQAKVLCLVPSCPGHNCTHKEHSQQQGTHSQHNPRHAVSLQAAAHGAGAHWRLPLFCNESLIIGHKSPLGAETAGAFLSTL